MLKLVSNHVIHDVQEMSRGWVEPTPVFCHYNHHPAVEEFRCSND
jgi:hypothetical protein